MKKIVVDKSEIGLYETKWFDYRMLNPFACNIAFMKAFAEEGIIHNDIIGKSKYRNQLYNLDVNDAQSWRWYGYMHRLRMFADKFGMPYNLYWEYSYRAIRSMNFERDSINIFANKKLKEKAVQYWDEYEASVVVYSKSSLFDVDLYQELDIQNKYYEYVCNKIIKKYNGEISSLTSVFLRLVSDRKIPISYLTKNLKRIIGEKNEC